MSTKLMVMSDLHMELMSANQIADFRVNFVNTFVANNPDVIVLAGDIHYLKKAPDGQGMYQAFNFFNSFNVPILYVPGNHDFFGTDMRKFYSIRNNGPVPTYEAVHTNLIHLNPRHPGFKMKDVGFKGGTLWYPNCGDELMMKNWIDYRAINNGFRQIHKEHAAFTKMVPSDIMISHHFPTDESIHSKYIGYMSNIFFCSYIDSIIEKWEKKPRLWIHDHTHEPFDYVSKHGFRVYCNPLGYEGENCNPDFWDRCILEIK